MAEPSPSCKEISQKAQEALLAKIPSEWRIPSSILSNLPRNVKPVFKSAGILTPQELDITDATDATTILEKIRSRTWSAREVTVAFCKRAAMAQQLVKCLMDIDFEGAIKRAMELDEIMEKTGQPVGPLHGLPVSIKDLTIVKGMHYSLGLAAWHDRKSDDDAVAVKSLRKAGAVVYVKTTMPQTGMALETTSNLWGRTLNPANTNLSAGGSSGGEGALNACHGAPIGIATDIGGSIRAPAAFNGLYGIKPTSRRCSYLGNTIPVPGQIAIPSAIGPMGRSLRDLELICETWLQDRPWYADPSVVPLPWVRQPAPQKATIGVLWFDEVVMPHPPVRRALRETVDKLKAAGHEIVDFKPYKHSYSWDVTLPLYFPTAARQLKEILAQVGDTMIPSVQQLSKGTKELTVPELMKFQAAQVSFQQEYLRHWNETASLTSTGQPVDAILCPSAACASFPHDFLPWWGYFSVWNLLNYPAMILPAGTVNKEIDVADQGYVPVTDWDKANHEVYDPELFDGAPISLQLVGRYLEEEKLFAVANAVDRDALQGRV
ncbi:hypothetical protein A1O3_06571 [Capronia epimyces CBS 606.96]|uniref:Amidase domain-containing protein n=1 Tax=Capronia epimyces CBS 606.96 TaxID=1182542 RepID=W9Y0I9_9EURO|nr:uncharacterized protein A1O3_06571 [Capronia epimyces CBS 606.96]EXJ82756.1 hypothetical protein A1O3_06571 [Capronia epimyces CBS 606.96]